MLRKIDLYVCGLLLAVPFLTSCEQAVFDNDKGIAPIIRVEVAISEEQERKFQELLLRFAESNQMKGGIRSIDVDGHYLVNFQRDNIQMLGTNTVTRNIYKVGFYPHRQAKSVSCDTILELLSSLKNAVVAEFDQSAFSEISPLNIEECTYEETGIK